MASLRFIRLKEVIALTSLSRSAIYEKIKTNDFPPQIKLGGKSVAWIDEEITNWIESKISISRA